VRSLLEQMSEQSCTASQGLERTQAELQGAVEAVAHREQECQHLREQIQAQANEIEQLQSKLQRATDMVS
jgi:predicted nuclease with TOPRIM domain